MTSAMRFIAATILLLFTATASAKTTALALSGGGARGFAHIGIIQALEEEGLEPDLIVGTSMGAVVGGLWAAGYSAADMKTIALTTDWSSLFLDRPSRRNLFLANKETRSRHIVSLRFRGWMPDVPLALSNGQQVWELFFNLTERAPYHAWPSFDDLRIPFRAVATDLISGKPVVFADGDLAEAMRASVSLPLVLVPYRLDTLLLVDGGVVENIPTEIARKQGAEAVIAVDMSTGFEAGTESDLPWDLADRVTTIMHLERNEQSLRAADVAIVPRVGTHKSSDFTNIAALIDSGYRAAKAQMPQLRAVLQKPESRPQRINFGSRSRFLRFTDSTPDSLLPPKRYAFGGVTLVPDSTVAQLPQGPRGLQRLANLRRSYISHGYTLAHATSMALESDGTLRSKWEEGRIRSIQVTGLRRYRPSTVLREFPLTTGQIFDLRRARRGITQIYGSDIFESVNLAVLPTDSGAHLTLRVRERESPQLRLGAGFSSERKGRGFVEFLNDNVLDMNARLTLFGKYGEMDEDASARLTFDRIPLTTSLDRFVKSYAMTDLLVRWKREEYNFFDATHRDTSFYYFERKSAELWMGSAFRRWAELAAGVRYEEIRAGGVLDEPTADVAYFGVRTLIDTKDDYPFPTSGFSWCGKYEYALKSTEAGRTFNRIQAMFDGYVPLRRRWVVHAKADWDWNDFILPLWGQFNLGGENSLLGLHEAERHGTAKMSVLTELRYDLLSRWIADTFVSAVYTVGAVSAESDPLPKSADYLHGLGGRLSVSTFLGPMSLTVGELLPSNFGTGQTRVYLNLGHEF